MVLHSPAARSYIWPRGFNAAQATEHFIRQWQLDTRTNDRPVIYCSQNSVNAGGMSYSSGDFVLDSTQLHIVPETEIPLGIVVADFH